MWIFGYGSLIWKVGFPYEERRVGFIDGWARRFWQDSTDHRGVPEAPGRVVTLVAEAGARTWGTAYRIAAPDRDRILERLDHRESGGYERHVVTVRDLDGPITDEALIYIGTAGNPNWGGPLPMDEIARVIARAEGPSGANIDYLMNLHASLTALDVQDEHVDELVELVRRLRYP